MSIVAIPDTLTTPEDGEALYEVVNGIRIEVAPMGIYSLFLGSMIHTYLNVFVLQHRLGWAISEGLFVLDESADLRRRPDVAFVSADRWSLDRPLPETGDWAIVPDLAIEVISPNDTFRQVMGKLHEYFSYGTRQVWLVLPFVRQIYCYDSPVRIRIFGAADTLETAVMPGFSLKLTQLFH